MLSIAPLLRTENHSLPYKTSRRFVFLNNSYRENNLRDVTSHPDKKMPDFVQARRIMPKSGSWLSSAAWRSWSPVCDGRPIALRRRLSPGLPLSDVTLCDNYYNTQEGFRTLQRTVNLLPIVVKRLGNANNKPM